MGKVSGIGGLFFRARDPVAIGQWYCDHLGVRDETNRLSLHSENPPLNLGRLALVLSKLRAEEALKTAVRTPTPS